MDGKESVGVLLLTDALHEDGEVVMVVKFVHLNLPCDLVGHAVLNLDGQVSTVVEAAELARCDLSLLDSASFGSKGSWNGDFFVQRAGVSAGTFTFLGVVCTRRRTWGRTRVSRAVKGPISKR